MFVVALLATTICAATEKKLHNFGNGADGAYPAAGLIFDAAGNLYGTTTSGGDYSCGSFQCGTVFELTPDGRGGWTEKKLHNFGNGADGSLPYGGLIFDAAGNLYGTTASGGEYNQGTVFELTPNGSGGWTEKKLHNFGNGTDGAFPDAGLVIDAAGNLYGTTYYGGDYPCGGRGCGTVFELTPKQGGGWTEKKLHNFRHGSDGAFPQASLILDAAGNLYGTTPVGGDRKGGTVFEVSPTVGGGWSEKVLYGFQFGGTDEYYPIASLIFDAVGNLYGTTWDGGAYYAGTVFELMPAEGGGWSEKRLHSFNSDGEDGSSPYAGVILDAAGNLYGTTTTGGDYGFCADGPCGTVFEMTPNGSGGWTEKKLHNFTFYGKDGSQSMAGLTLDAAGNLYGTTLAGGDYDGGTVFEITPQ
jgi:uncharacterized repeat protein (TIGR03803 family)